MAFSDYLTTWCTIHRDDDTPSAAGSIDGQAFSSSIGRVRCSKPVPIDPSKRGETLGRDGLVLDTIIYIEQPQGLRPGHQIRIGARRFDVDAEVDIVGFGRVVKVLCREAVA